LENGGYIKKTVFKQIPNLNTFNLIVSVVGGGNIRSKPYAKDDRYLVKKVSYNTVLKAITLLDNGWYVLEDGNLIHSSLVLPLKKIKNNDNNTPNTTISLNDSKNVNVLDIIQKGLIKALKDNNKLAEMIKLNSKQIQQLSKRSKHIIRLLNASKKTNKFYVTLAETQIYNKENIKVGKYPKNEFIPVVKIKDNKAYLDNDNYVYLDYLKKIDKNDKFDSNISAMIEKIFNKNKKLHEKLLKLEIKVEKNTKELKTKASKKDLERLALEIESLKAKLKEVVKIIKKRKQIK